MSIIEEIRQHVPQDKWPTHPFSAFPFGEMFPDENFPILPPGLKWDRLTGMRDWCVFDECGWLVASIKTCYPEAKFIGE